MRKGEELKAPRYASAAATRDYITIRDIIPNRNKLEVNKQEMEINKLIKYKYKNNVQIVDVIKAIQTEK